MTALSRRRFLQTGLAAAATVTFGPGFWRDALAVPPAQPGAGPYGPLRAPDVNGIMLPQGFTSKVIAIAEQPVPGTAYVFPKFPDAQATFPTPDRGWILVTNSEIGDRLGGVSAIRFDAGGTIVSAYRILIGTSTNCAGGPTPWGTWLSCEEFQRGLVWECDPTGAKPSNARPAMGVFQHEAACVDAINEHVYMSEDLEGGGLYRFAPAAYPDLAAGVLEIACDGGCGTVIWKPLPDPRFTGAIALRHQHADSLKFGRGEGIWYDAGLVYLATTTDQAIHVYDTAAATVSVLYRYGNAPGSPLRGVDNVHVSRSGDLFVGEDSYDGDADAMDVCIITPERQVARFLKLTGPEHFMPGNQSETVGITFDPSGTRMYMGSQRYLANGIVYEITGPFRQAHPTITAPAVDGCPPAAAPPAPPTAVAGLGTAVGAPGLPIGIEVGRRISIDSLIRRGLVIGITLDAPATVKVRITARVTTNGRRRTVTLATATRKPGRGHTTLRIKPSRAQARLLRARRRALTANVEVRITTPGAPERVLRRAVSLRMPATRPKQRATS